MSPELLQWVKFSLFSSYFNHFTAMDTAKQNLGKKVRDKILRLVNVAKSSDNAPGIVQEASATEADAARLRAMASKGASAI